MRIRSLRRREKSQAALATATAAKAPRPARHATEEALLLHFWLDCNYPLSQRRLSRRRLGAPLRERLAPVLPADHRQSKHAALQVARACELRRRG